MSYVYVLTSSSVKGICKVGYTRNSPYDRAAHITKNDGNQWVVDWSRKFNTVVMAQIVEAYALRSLSRFCRPRLCNTEFFEISPYYAKKSLNEAYDEYTSLPWAREDTKADVLARDMAYIRLLERNPNYFFDHSSWYWQHKKYSELLELKNNHPELFFSRMKI